MNANELADQLDQQETIASMTTLRKIATMLRQQQAEIEALKLQNDNYWVMIEILRQKVKEQEK